MTYEQDTTYQRCAGAIDPRPKPSQPEGPGWYLVSAFPYYDTVMFVWEREAPGKCMYNIDDGHCDAPCQPGWILCSAHLPR